MTNVPIVPLPSGASLSISDINPSNRDGLLGRFTDKMKKDIKDEQQEALATALP